MKTVAVLLLISAAASALEWNDFRVKWNTWVLDPFRWSSFFEVPLTKQAAEEEGWDNLGDLDTLATDVYCYPGDGQHCMLYDANGFVCGFQAGILVNDTVSAASVYDLEIFDMYTIKTLFGMKYYTTVVYTVDPEIIKAGGRTDMNGLTGEAGVWIALKDGYMAIARYLTDLDTKWKKQACIPEMGTHYYYDMSTELECKNFLPWFLLFQDGELSGMGLQAFGACTIQERSWCEWVPAIAIQPTIPDTAQCVIDWADKYGVISIHYYFTSKPWDIKC